MGTVRVIAKTHRERAIASLTLAFSCDPVMRWGWPDPERYLTCWPRIADEFGGRAFDHGTAHGLEDCVAIALWLPPGVQPDAEIVMRLMRESMNDKTFEEIIGVFEQMDALHPTVDHWYLPLTGVVPSPKAAALVARSCDMP